MRSSRATCPIGSKLWSCDLFAGILFLLLLKPLVFLLRDLADAQVIVQVWQLRVADRDGERLLLIFHR
jgi:hypothetical protein